MLQVASHALGSRVALAGFLGGDNLGELFSVCNEASFAFVVNDEVLKGWLLKCQHPRRSGLCDWLLNEHPLVGNFNLRGLKLGQFYDFP